MDKATDRLLTLLVIFVVALALGAVLLRACAPKPPVATPTATRTATVEPSDTPVPPSATPEPTRTDTPEPTLTHTPEATFTPQPTFTHTATVEPEATKDYCWWNWYAGSVVCYPRLNWHPRPEGRFLR